MTLTDKLIILTDPLAFATWQARREYINQLEAEYRPLKLPDLLALSSVNQMRKLRMWHEHQHGWNGELQES